MDSTHNQRKNLILAELGHTERNTLLPGLELVRMPLGKVIYESQDVMGSVYFPVDCIVALLYAAEGGASTQIAVVGYDGVVGVALFMGGLSTSSRAVVQSGGYAYRLSAKLLKREFDRNAGFQNLLLRYTLSLITQMSQTAVCNRHHSVHQQFCRWLLLSLDRRSDNTVPTTQVLIAELMGVRREGISSTAAKLEKQGVIKYSRGCITVVDRAALTECSCECYGVVKHETDRLRAMPLAMSA